MFYSASAFDQDLGWCVDDAVDLCVYGNILRVHQHPVRVDVVRCHASGGWLRALASADDDPGAHRDTQADVYTHGRRHD